jgi:hypothetical protein
MLLLNLLHIEMSEPRKKNSRISLQFFLVVVVISNIYSLHCAAAAWCLMICTVSISCVCNLNHKKNFYYCGRRDEFFSTIQNAFLCAFLFDFRLLYYWSCCCCSCCVFCHCREIDFSLYIGIFLFLHWNEFVYILHRPAVVAIDWE